ncbi:hypothetical protein OHA27_15725 [Streptomyces sp. NBC_01619]|uniref:hypothetical protein n=1 Tax=Streptomyces sp. NBC_01619 TaxID=2975901 RepID=UPI00225969D1|nr:hypothetical protein [Streptomyces sp. NBC_01619]MCX4511735.1 hypothetical protein [Streptomyces sp. NBC_01619]
MTEQIETVGQTEGTEKVGQSGQTEGADQAEQIEQIEQAEGAEQSARVGQTAGTTEPPVETGQPAEAVETEQRAEAVEPVTDTDAPPRDRRRVLRALARWTAAVLVCGGLGTGTAYGIAAMERSDVPGLATESDGRWDYPRLSLPALPEGSPRPFTDGNQHEIHHADLRELLLPAPAGATEDKKLNGGWVSNAQYVSEYAKDHRPDLEQALTDYAVRHIAARGWTMPDGTTSRVYLLRFDSAGTAEEFTGIELGVGLSPDVALATAPGDAELDEGWDVEGPAVGKSAISVYTEAKPIGPVQTRQAYIQAGDTVALIFQSRKGEALSVPFHQTVVLQNQLLG